MMTSNNPIRFALVSFLCFFMMTLFMVVPGAHAQDPLILFTDNVDQPPLEPTDMELELENYILNATSTIDAAIYGFNRESIKVALLAADIRGVTVRVVTDDDAYTSYKSYYDDLRAAGILVRWDKLGSIMHNKFFIIDGQIVWTGSTNITDNGFTLNHNNSIVFDSATLATIYQEEFDQMLGTAPRYRGAFGTEKVAQTTTSLTYAGMPVEVYFSPKNGAMDELLAEVNAATSSIYFCIFYMTDNTLRDALISKKQNNPTMEIRGIMDAEGAANYYADEEALCEAGIQIKVEDFPGKMHNKFMVIDAGTNAARTITGSMNWTGAGGDANDENTLIIHDGLIPGRPISTVYKLEYDYLYSSLSPDTLCISMPPDALLEIELMKIGTSLQIRSAWIGESVAYHLYGVNSEATMDLGTWEIKVEDLEYNPFGTWETDHSTYIQFTMTDTTQFPDGNYVLVAENLEGEGPYGIKSNDDDRTPDDNKTAPICIGCSDPAGYADVVINEFLADPPADLAGDANGDGVRDDWDDEFVEIINISDHRVNLSGAILTDNIKIKHTFPRGSYLDPCQSLVVFGGGLPNETPGYFGTALVQTATSLLQLNNTGDTVTLINDLQVLDQVTYGSEGGNDVSLVRDPEATRYAPFVSSATVGAMVAYTPGFAIDDTTTCITGECAIASVSIDSVAPGSTISLATEMTLTAVGYGEEPLSYEWDMNYKGGVFTTDLTGISVQHTFPRAGIFTVAVRMTDSCGDPGSQVVMDTMQVIVNSEVVTCDDITINEIDSDTLGTDVLEFVELHNDSGYAVNMAADGYVLVFYNGGNDLAYAVMNMTGLIGDDSFYLLGNNGVSPTPDQTFSSLQNGADAIALFKSAEASTCSATLFKTNNAVSSPPTECVRVDAIVYDTGQADDTGLLNGLGQSVQINEGPTGFPSDTHSIQRPTDSQGCPGGWSTNFKVDIPTPGSTNDPCMMATASITVASPALSICLGTESSFSGAGTGDGSLSYAWDFYYNGVSFVEDTTGTSAVHTYLTAGTYRVAFQVTDSCSRPEPQVVIDTVLITVVDCAGACADLTINEVDADTASTDVLEFVELHNASGVSVDMSLGGYVLVLFNGSNDASYFAIDLPDTIANNGFYVIGNTGVTPDLVFPDDTMENGADAVALYRGSGCSAALFPNNTPADFTVGDCQLVDAICYDTDDPDDVGLMAALGQTEQFNEDPDAGHPSETNSIQRITDSQGCPQGWAGNAEVDAPTPGIANGLCGTVSASIGPVLPAAEVCRGTEQSFSGSGTGQGALTYEWDFDYSGVFSADMTGQNVLYTYGTLGSWTVALRVTDSCINPGAQSTITTTTVNILDCCPSPTATITSIVPGRQVPVSTLMTFEGSGTGEGTLTLEWDFNYDGTTFTSTPTVGSPANHTYDTAGSYRVALRVTDSCTTPGPLSVITTTPVVVYAGGGTCNDITINEVDPDQTSTDTAEFVELHNATGALVDFSTENYVIVFYNGSTLDDGSDDKAYYAANLTGSLTDSGFYLIGKSGMSPTPDLSFTASMQNGRDAVALYRGAGCDTGDFDTSSPGETVPAMLIGDCILVDAIVYGGAPDDTGLLTALGQSFQFDENSGGNAAYESIQRVTDSQGCPMITQASDVTTGGPTPKASNSSCTAVIASITSIQPDTTVCQGVEQTFSGFGYGEGAVTLEWDVDYDFATFDVDLSGSPALYTYPSPGTYTLALRVTDSCGTPGSEIVTTTITVNDCCDPISASITSVLPGYTICSGTEVQFTGTGSGEGSLVYEWDFDYDGVTFTQDGTGTSVAHTFNTAKGHTVAFRVTDACSLPSSQTALDTVPLIVNACSSGCPDITINELDSEQVGTDIREFIELHNNTGASIDLTGEGYTLVLFNGAYDTSYGSFDLSGTLADDGFYLVGNAAVSPDVVFADSLMQNGADGAALYRGDTCSALSIPNGTAAATRIGACVLVDAVVYDTDDEDDVGLLAALGLNEQINENEGLDAEHQSIQRVTDSLGCAFGWETPNWTTDNPTTGVSNTTCSPAAITDLSVQPGTTICQGTVLTFDGAATGEGILTYEWDFDYNGVTFTADDSGQTVTWTYATPGSYTVALQITDECTMPGPQSVMTTVDITVNDCCTLATAAIDSVSPGNTVCLTTQQTFNGSGTGQGTLSYAWDFHYDGSFTAEATGQNPAYTYLSAGSYVVALQVTDSCSVPGPQTALTTAPIIINPCSGACPDITINEIDSDTPGQDVAEFVELHNDTGFGIDLAADGYVLVFYNGSDDASYFVQALSGSIVDGGFYLIGNAALTPDETFPDGSMENGPDAVAIYRGLDCSDVDFPNDSPAAVTVGNCTLVDAIIYGAPPTDDALKDALELAEQIDENANGKKDVQSIQRVTDSQGCPMGWETPNFIVDGPTPGVSNLSCTTVSASIVSILPDPAVCQGTEQTFRGTGTGEGTLTYEWDFDYIAPTFDVMMSGTSVAYTYPSIGSFTVALRVTDSCTNPSAQQAIETFTVTINDCCAAISASVSSITPAPTVCLSTAQTFTGSGTGEGTLAYEWDFHYNGVSFNQESTSNPATYTYLATGSYTVALRVTDSCIVPGAQQIMITTPVVVNSCPGGGYCPDVTINEVDSDQADLVNEEFVELHNNTNHLVDLAADNYVLVFYNGFTDASYFAVALTGSMAIDGYYLIGNSSLSPAPDQVFQDSGLQNGPDAVALYRGEYCSASSFPNNTPAAISVGECTLVDALLYGAPPDDSGLMTALGADVQIDENNNGIADAESIQRITDSQGCPQTWDGNWKVTTPTPGATN